jgi:hypothetical protein
MRWAGHEACMGEARTVYKISLGRSAKKRSLWRPVNERIKKRFVFKKKSLKMWTELISFGI